jgi:dihydropteroate synthase
VMHTRGLPSEWASQARLRNDEVLPAVLAVLAGLAERLSAALDAGIASECVVLDPGFGFGKVGSVNWALLRNFESLQSFDRPLIVGLSRKGFLSAPGTTEPANERDDLTHAADTVAILAGAHIVRVHDVRGAVRAAAVADAARNG